MVLRVVAVIVAVAAFPVAADARSSPPPRWRAILPHYGGRITGLDVVGAHGRRALTRPHGASDGLPAWSPDGGLVAFVREDKRGRYDGLYVVASSGGTPRRLVRGHGFVLQLEWSPDGRR